MTLDGSFSRGEEIANFVSHLVGASIALIGLVILIVYASINSSGIHIVSASIFGACMLILYISSTLYHGLKSKRAKNVFFICDQISIFLMIAGSYTPIALVALGGTLGWIMFGIEWGIAILGIIYISVFSKGYEKGIHPIKVIAFIIMGWLALIAIKPLSVMLTGWGLALLLAGGVFYTLGVVFFAMEKVKYNHLVWHLFVILGTLSHYLMVFMYIIPMRVN